jgi:hypothetical protein
VKDFGVFEARLFCVMLLVFQWIIDLYRQREKSGLFCWITVERIWRCCHPLHEGGHGADTPKARDLIGEAQQQRRRMLSVR